MVVELPASQLPSLRLRRVGDAPMRADGDYVLYWMTAARRTRHSHALDRACELSRALQLPLVVLEALRCDYRWASDRLHAFVWQGMRDQATRFAEAGVLYHPYVEPEMGAGKGLLAKLAERAAVVVADEWPCFFLRGLPDKVAPKLAVAMEAVDGCGLLPLRQPDGKLFTRAFSLRIHLQKHLVAQLEHLASADPLKDLPQQQISLGKDVSSRWPAAALDVSPESLAALPIDHDVGVSPVMTGGESAARARLDAFLDRHLADYGDGRNHPDSDTASGLSPWLHFGHIASQEVFLAIAEREEWSPDMASDQSRGAREGWWNMSASAESFLDELITWREIGFNMCHLRDDYDSFTSLPDWAKETMQEHADDPREELYDLDSLQNAETSDPIWNAAQRQLVREGRMHNYLRMLWGKKIYGWSPTPQAALDTMIELNNRYAVDGRDPNSYSGIFWVLGRYDRAWGPERSVFGKLRYMTSDSTKRKLRMNEYLARYGS